MAAQVAAGLEPVTDGGLSGEARRLTDAWLATARLTDKAVKQAVTGPYTTGRSGHGSARDRTAATLGASDRLHDVLGELVAAGCPLIEIHEPAATQIGEDPGERALFRDAHLRLLEGLTGTHLSLALTGGNADAAGIETLLAAPYASLAVDLIAGPDNWRLVVAAPGDRGIVCGALAARAGSADGPELLHWAAAYAASTGGRGPARVGLATASSLAHLSWDDAVGKMQRLGAAARLFDMTPEERVQHVDPRAVSIRSAALGRVDRPASRRPDQGDDPT